MMSQSVQEPNSDRPLGGRYKVISQLGAGGFGQTFLVQDLHLPGWPQCVLKKLSPQTQDDDKLEMARRLFNTEAQVLYQLGNHDQIPRLLAHFEDNQEFYLAQEYIAGKPLTKELRGGKPWGEERAIAVLQDILQVLAFVHRRQVIHRDVKPANLIRRHADGKMVLIDFGAVKQVSIPDANSVPGQTDLTISIGTQGFIPNEQLAGKPRFSSDVYAVGIIGIWALTGIHPKQLKDDPKTGEIDWHDAAEQVSPELTAILDQMVRYDFRDRYPTAVEALAALQDLVQARCQPIAKSLATALNTPSSPSAALADSPSTLAEWATLEDIESDLEQDATSPWLSAPPLPPTLTLAHKPEANLAALAQSSSDLTHQQPQRKSDTRLGRSLLSFRWLALTMTTVGVALTPALGSRLKPPAVSPPAAVKSFSAILLAFLPEQQAIDLRLDANRLRRTGRHEEALHLYDEVLKLKPNDAETYRGRCESLNALQQPNEAIVACNDALAANPGYAEAMVSKGNALVQQRRFFEALRLYDQAIGLNPDLAEAWAGQGITLQTLGRSAEALIALNRSITLKRNSAEVWATQGEALWNLGRYNEAIAALDKALQLQPEHPAALHLRQKAREKLGR